METKPHYLVWR